jgi:septal ring factor EnvC (AmiA/AmiB activator)
LFLLLTGTELSDLKEVKNALHSELHKKDNAISEIRIVESVLRSEIKELQSALEDQMAELQYRRDAATADATERVLKSRKNRRSSRDGREEMKIKLVR